MSSNRNVSNKSEKTRKNPSGIKPHSSAIFQTSVYDYPDLESLDDYYEGRIPGAFLYSRNGLPNSSELGQLVADYERTESGVVCSSGMGALVIAILSSLGIGDHIVASRDLYGGTSILLTDEFPRLGIKSSFVDSTSTEEVQAAIETNTKMVLVETISNPTMKICDIQKVAKISQKAGTILLVDNTFATPFVIRPTQSGADVVMHSGTKYLGGHDDLTIGILCGRAKLMSRASQFCTRSGIMAGPFDSWLATRSASTWEMRVIQSSNNAAKLAKYLESRSDKISNVYYPGLRSHPQNALAKRIFEKDMFGGMLSFDLTGGLTSASKFVKALKTITLTPSLGGVHTAISHPGKTSHRSLTQQQKRESGITDAMIRVSAGIESYEKIEREFEEALSVA